MADSDLFVCSECQCVDIIELTKPDQRFLCGHCDPEKTWHGYFDRERYRPEQDFVINPPASNASD